MKVSTDIIKKYIFAALLNYKINDFGTQFNRVYLNKIEMVNII